MLREMIGYLAERVAALEEENGRLRDEVNDWHTFSNGALRREQRTEREAALLAASMWNEFEEGP